MSGSTKKHGKYCNYSTSVSRFICAFTHGHILRLITVYALCSLLQKRFSNDEVKTEAQETYSRDLPEKQYFLTPANITVYN